MSPAQRKIIEAGAAKGGATGALYKTMLEQDDALLASADTAERTDLLTSAPDPLKNQSTALQRAAQARDKAKLRASGAGVNKPTKPGAGATPGQSGVLGGTRNYSILGK